MLLYKSLFGEMAMVNTETNFSSLTYAISGGKFGRSRINGGNAQVVVNVREIDTTSQETSREPTGMDLPNSRPVSC